jgi:hypothetical protein
MRKQFFFLGMLFALTASAQKTKKPQSLTSEEIIEDCNKIGMSRTKLYQKIKSISNQSIGDFIRTIRLKKSGSDYDA